MELSPNQQNLEKELDWLKQIIQIRFDFQNNQTSQITSLPSLKFHIKAQVDQQASFPEQALVWAKKNGEQDAWYVTLYDSPDSTQFNRSRGYLCAVKDNIPIDRLLEIRGDWVLIDTVCGAIKPDTNLVAYQDVTKAWVPRCFTNIPDGYSIDMEFADLAQFLEKLPENQATALHEYVQTVNKHLFWQQFYQQQNISLFTPPPLAPNESVYARFVLENKLDFYDRLLLIMSLAPQIAPDFFQKYLVTNYGYASPDSGLIRGSHYEGVFPSGNTFLFLSHVHDIHSRFARLRWMKQDSVLLQHKIVFLSSVAPYEPMWAGGLVIDADYFMLLTEIEDAIEEDFLLLP